MWPFRKKALSGTPSVVSAMNQGWAPWPLIGSGSQQRIVDVYNRAQSANYSWMYTNSPALRTVIDVIVRNVGQLDLRLYKETSEAERTPDPDHPAALSLRYPNETTPSDKFVRELFKDFLIHDNAYSLIDQGANDQLTFARLPAFMLEVQGSNLWEVENYRVWPQGAWTSGGTWGGGGSWKDFPPASVLHWHGENPLDPRIGLSLLDTIRDVIAEDAALQQATIELANAGLQEPIWGFRPLDAPEWSTEARRAMEEDLQNRLRSRNTKPVVMGDGMELRSFGMSPRDAQMYEIRRWALERVASLYGVPLGMIGLDPNVADARQEFLTDCLPPYCEAFTKMLNHRILVGVYSDTQGCFEFNLDEKSVNADERIKTLVSATGRAVMLTDEARSVLNLPPVDGGDELVTPLNVIVGEKPSPMVMPPQDPNKPATLDGSYRSKMTARRRSGQGMAGRRSRGPRRTRRRRPWSRMPQFHPRRAADMERQRRNIDVFQGVVQDHFNRLERSLYSGGASKNECSPGAAEGWAPGTGADREFTGDINRALERTVQAEGDLYMLKLASSDNFDMRRVQNYLRAMAEGAAGAINDTIRSEIDTLGVDDAMARAPAHVASSGTSLGGRSTMWAREEAARQSGTFRDAA